MKARTATVVGVALLSTGCTEVLGRMEGLPLTVGLNQPLVQEAVRTSATLGWEIAGGLVVLLGFHCWYKATHGEPWLGLLKQYLEGLVVCIVLLATMPTGHGPVQWIIDAGMYLGDRFKPGVHLAVVFEQIVSKYSNIVSDFVHRPMSAEAAAFRWIEAWQYYMSSPLIAALVIANTCAIFVMRLMVQSAFVWLIAFYEMIGPLLVPLVILPQTRHVFLGWLRTFISIALWPWLFALAERLAVAVPYATWVGTDRYDGSLPSGLETIFQGQIMFLVLNVIFFFVYLGIPVAAHLLVSGAGRSFRGVLA